jgi:hypothetical protein
MGRKSKKSRNFAMIHKKTVESNEWKDLSSSAKLIYIYLKVKYNGHNNGKISFKYHVSEFSSSTTSRSLKELISKGWISKTKHGGLYRYYCLYKLTGAYDEIR